MSVAAPVAAGKPSGVRRMLDRLNSALPSRASVALPFIGSFGSPRRSSSNGHTHTGGHRRLMRAPYSVSQLLADAAPAEWGPSNLLRHTNGASFRFKHALTVYFFYLATVVSLAVAVSALISCVYLQSSLLTLPWALVTVSVVYGIITHQAYAALMSAWNGHNQIDLRRFVGAATSVCTGSSLPLHAPTRLDNVWDSVFGVIVSLCEIAPMVCTAIGGVHTSTLSGAIRWLFASGLACATIVVGLRTLTVGLFLLGFATSQHLPRSVRRAQCTQAAVSALMTALERCSERIARRLRWRDIDFIEYTDSVTARSAMAGQEAVPSPFDASPESRSFHRKSYVKRQSERSMHMDTVRDAVQDTLGPPRNDRVDGTGSADHLFLRAASAASFSGLYQRQNSPDRPLSMRAPGQYSMRSAQASGSMNGGMDDAPQNHAVHSPSKWSQGSRSQAQHTPLTTEHNTSPRARGILRNPSSTRTPYSPPRAVDSAAASAPRRSAAELASELIHKMSASGGVALDRPRSRVGSTATQPMDAASLGDASESFRGATTESGLSVQVREGARLSWRRAGLEMNVQTTPTASHGASDSPTKSATVHASAAEVDPSSSSSESSRRLHVSEASAVSNSPPLVPQANFGPAPTFATLGAPAISPIREMSMESDTLASRSANDLPHIGRLSPEGGDEKRVVTASTAPAPVADASPMLHRPPLTGTRAPSTSDADAAPVASAASACSAQSSSLTGSAGLGAVGGSSRFLLSSGRSLTINKPAAQTPAALAAFLADARRSRQLLADQALDDIEALPGSVSELTARSPPSSQATPVVSPRLELELLASSRLPSGRDFDSARASSDAQSARSPSWGTMPHRAGSSTTMDASIGDSTRRSARFPIASVHGRLSPVMDTSVAEMPAASDGSPRATDINAAASWALRKPLRPDEAVSGEYRRSVSNIGGASPAASSGRGLHSRHTSVIDDAPPGAMQPPPMIAMRSRSLAGAAGAVAASGYISGESAISMLSPRKDSDDDDDDEPTGRAKARIVGPSERAIMLVYSADVAAFALTGGVVHERQVLLADDCVPCAVTSAPVRKALKGAISSCFPVPTPSTTVAAQRLDQAEEGFADMIDEHVDEEDDKLPSGATGRGACARFCCQRCWRPVVTRLPWLPRLISVPCMPLMWLLDSFECTLGWRCQWGIAPWTIFAPCGSCKWGTTLTFIFSLILTTLIALGASSRATIASITVGMVALFFGTLCHLRVKRRETPKSTGSPRLWQSAHPVTNPLDAPSPRVAPGAPSPVAPRPSITAAATGLDDDGVDVHSCCATFSVCAARARLSLWLCYMRSKHRGTHKVVGWMAAGVALWIVAAVGEAAKHAHASDVATPRAILQQQDYAHPVFVCFALASAFCMAMAVSKLVTTIYTNSVIGYVSAPRPAAFSVLVVGYVIMGIGMILLGSAVFPPHSLEGDGSAMATREPIIGPRSNLPICQERWFGLGIRDAVYFSALSYDDGAHVNIDLALWFNRNDTAAESGGAPDWRIIYMESAPVQFYHLFSASRNVSVVAVRGTARLSDEIQNFAFWGDTMLVQTFSALAPVAPLLSDEVVADLVFHFGKVNFLRASLGVNPSLYVQPLLDYVLAAQARGFSYTDAAQGINVTVAASNWLFVGHSMGGSTAAILGASVDAPAVSISGPGVYFSRRSFGIVKERLFKNVVNLIPELDVLSGVDRAAGMTQMMSCAANDYATCHRLHSTLSTLHEACGNPSGRGYRNLFAKGAGV